MKIIQIDGFKGLITAAFIGILPICRLCSIPRNGVNALME